MSIRRTLKHLCINKKIPSFIPHGTFQRIYILFWSEVSRETNADTTKKVFYPNTCSTWNTGQQKLFLKTCPFDFCSTWKKSASEKPGLKYRLFHVEQMGIYSFFTFFECFLFHVEYGKEFCQYPRIPKNCFMWNNRDGFSFGGCFGFMICFTWNIFLHLLTSNYFYCLVFLIKDIFG